MTTPDTIRNCFASGLSKCTSGQVFPALRCSPLIKRPWHHRLTVLLIAVILTISLAGEALHLLPGMGHYVCMPNGHCLWLGISQSDGHDLGESDSPESGHAWNVPKDPKGRILSEDECAICNLLTLRFKPCVVICEAPPSLLLGTLDIYQTAFILSGEVSLHGARAPPACELYCS